jgi:hypothetical protein
VLLIPHHGTEKASTGRATQYMMRPIYYAGTSTTYQSQLSHSETMILFASLCAGTRPRPLDILKDSRHQLEDLTRTQQCAYINTSSKDCHLSTASCSCIFWIC